MEIFKSLALNILIEALYPVLMGGVVLVLGQAYMWWKRLTGFEVDEATRQRLNEAFSRAVLYGIRTGVSNSDKLTRAAQYLEEFNPGDLQKFGLTNRDKLVRRLIPVLPESAGHDDTE